MEGFEIFTGRRTINCKPGRRYKTGIIFCKKADKKKGDPDRNLVPL